MFPAVRRAPAPLSMDHLMRAGFTFRNVDRDPHCRTVAEPADAVVFAGSLARVNGWSLRLSPRLSAALEARHDERLAEVSP